MINLKGRLIDFINEHPRCFEEPLVCGGMHMSRGRRHHLTLSTYDFTGAILHVAGYSLQLDAGNIRLPLNAPWLDREWVEHEALLGWSQDVDISALARQLWAREYGDEEAYKLPLYHTPLTRRGETVATYYWDEGSIERASVISFLRGAVPWELSECASPSIKPRWKR